MLEFTELKLFLIKDDKVALFMAVAAVASVRILHSTELDDNIAQTENAFLVSATFSGGSTDGTSHIAQHYLLLISFMLESVRRKRVFLVCNAIFVFIVLSKTTNTKWHKKGANSEWQLRRCVNKLSSCLRRMNDVCFFRLFFFFLFFVLCQNANILLRKKKEEMWKEITEAISIARRLLQQR